MPYSPTEQDPRLEVAFSTIFLNVESIATLISTLLKDFSSIYKIYKDRISSRVLLLTNLKALLYRKERYSIVECDT